MVINMLDVFICYLMVFITLKSIVSKIISQFLNSAVFVLFCLIVTETFYGLIPYLFREVQVVLLSFSFGNLTKFWMKLRLPRLLSNGRSHQYKAAFFVLH